MNDLKSSSLLKLDTKISRMDLVQKPNGTNIKELGSNLKKALLSDNTFLSNLNVHDKNTTNSVAKASGSYKDLVLSVLKRKQTTA